MWFTMPISARTFFRIQSSGKWMTKITLNPSFRQQQKKKKEERRSLLATIETCWISTGMIVRTYPIFSHSLVHSYLNGWIPKLNGFTILWVWNLINSIRIVLKHMFPVSWYYDLISVFEFSFSFGSSISTWTFTVNVLQKERRSKNTDWNCM